MQIIQFFFALLAITVAVVTAAPAAAAGITDTDRLLAELDQQQGLINDAFKAEQALADFTKQKIAQIKLDQGISTRKGDKAALQDLAKQLKSFQDDQKAVNDVITSIVEQSKKVSIAISNERFKITGGF
ncbi:hypothetical protein HDU97_007066 [Phlyctochytrium planicorne]|nr:hypothetical protein HDU97_007066 [Phlyctochytrium planicorne]